MDLIATAYIHTQDIHIHTQERSRFELSATQRANEAIKLAADAEEAEKLRGTSTLAQRCVSVYHTYIHACMHSYGLSDQSQQAIDASQDTCIHTCINTCMHTSIHACIHRGCQTSHNKPLIHLKMHTYIHKYIHPSIHTYIQAVRPVTASH